MKHKPSDQVMDRIAENAQIINDEYIAEKARKKKIKHLLYSFKQIHLNV